MSKLPFDLKAAIEAAKKTGPNMAEPKKATGGAKPYAPPAAGLARLRFVGYIELGLREVVFQGEKKMQRKVRFIFELSGPKHPAKEVDGKKVPERISFVETLSDHEKANLPKLFKAMNYDGTATHFAELLGRPFLGEVVHSKFTKRDGSPGVTASLKNNGAYTVRSPHVEDPETGETKILTVQEALSEIRIFLWDHPSKEMWDALYIDGKYPDGKSKNVLQEEIIDAVDWESSTMYEILNNPVNVPDAEQPTPTEENFGDDEDPLNFID